ncbi:hypothetical protein F4780DRAFT_523508 [Xylariomycetidae sp. FL0641]|nr:hypothetical protein F4780DRAFT_523508 [Xylariomycetidae sp. FL0641]
MQTASNSHHAHSGSVSSTASGPYPSMPGSPTLTNPDMILPDYDDSISSPDRSQSPLMMWRNNHGDMQFDLTPEVLSGPVNPSTPIIYGNGTMLSDIGEVTEVESTCPRTRSRQSSVSTLQQFPIRTTSKMAHETMKRDPRASRERRASTDSTSTVTTNEQNGLFADFDDSVSVGDSNFQGDDEESVADSYIDDHSMQESISPAREYPKNRLEEDRFSTALSRRAEEILANAKQRLTAMEGNLNRARTSLASPPMSSMGSESTPSPPPLIRPSTAKSHDSAYRVGLSGHSRISSENNVPGQSKLSAGTDRSLSALGVAGGYRQTLQNSRSADFAREKPSIYTPENAVYGSWAFAQSRPALLPDHGLEPLSEDDVSEGPGSSGVPLEETKLDTFLSPTSGSYSDQGLRRSASTVQMRDIKDQMKDLKGRLSTLRDQARADSMKRRSLQSLRTPSPFTHARVEQWYADRNGDAEETVAAPDSSVPHEQSRTPSGCGEENDESPIEYVKTPELEDDSELSEYSDADENDPVTQLTPAEFVQNSARKAETPAPEEAVDDIGDQEDMRTEDGSDDEGEEEEEDEDGNVFDSGSESGDSYYQDTVQNQVSHEDREDAFDYEHFFLHSAMGSMSRKRMERRDSESSFSSEDSVETTKGPNAGTDARSSATRVGRPSRRGSTGSISTLDSFASFATATEGRSGRTTRADTSAIDDSVDAFDISAGDTQYYTPESAKRAIFISGKRTSSSNPSPRQSSFARRPQSSAASFMHRPSVSSLGSAGTTRSFPLVNRPKVNGGILTPRESPDQELKQISETLMSETTSICERESIHQAEKADAIEALQRDDQILVERLVASLGRCVLGLTESGRASSENRMYRRRIEAARRLLEGEDMAP